MADDAVSPEFQQLLDKSAQDAKAAYRCAHAYLGNSYAELQLNDPHQARVFFEVAVALGHQTAGEDLFCCYLNGEIPQQNPGDCLQLAHALSQS